MRNLIKWWDREERRKGIPYTSHTLEIFNGNTWKFDLLHLKQVHPPSHDLSILSLGPPQPGTLKMFWNYSTLILLCCREVELCHNWAEGAPGPCSWNYQVAQLGHVLFSCYGPSPAWPVHLIMRLTLQGVANGKDVHEDGLQGAPCKEGKTPRQAQ